MWKTFKRIWAIGFTIGIIAFVVWLPFLEDYPKVVSKGISLFNLLWWALGGGGAMIHECWKEDN